VKALEQQSFETVLADSFRSHERRMVRYMTENREKYLASASFIDCNVKDRDFVFSRIAFAILSANTPFDASVRALNYVLENKGTASRKDIQEFTCVPAKADYVNKLWDSCVIGHAFYLRDAGESWSEYRYRLQREVKGLGLAKASFAVSLLYPLQADVACIDTWMQKVFLGNSSFKQLSKATYEIVEAKVRKYARRVGVGTFIAQWMIWDHARGGMHNEHAIFPGSHKVGGE
jgi:thermostable 8-oxoguanine DNA glycosylase